MNTTAVLETAPLVAFVLSGWVATYIFRARPLPDTSIVSRVKMRPWLKYTFGFLRATLWLVWVSAVSLLCYFRVTGGFESSGDAADIGIAVLVLSGWFLFGEDMFRSSRDALITERGLYLGGFLWNWSWYESAEASDYIFGETAVRFGVRARGLKRLWAKQLFLSSLWYDLKPSDIELMSRLVSDVKAIR